MTAARPEFSNSMVLLMSLTVCLISPDTCHTTGESRCHMKHGGALTVPTALPHIDPRLTPLSSLRSPIRRTAAPRRGFVSPHSQPFTHPTFRRQPGCHRLPDIPPPPPPLGSDVGHFPPGTWSAQGKPFSLRDRCFEEMGYFQRMQEFAR
jgi:hypothetical protein